MNLKKRFLKPLAMVVFVVMLLDFVSCGTILYPERRGKSHSRRIDPKVAILNGCFAFFFLVPGLVAFIVDFATGAIYLPRGKRAWSRLDKMKGMKVVKVDPEKLDKETIERILKEHTGKDIDLDQQPLQVFTGGDVDQKALTQTLSDMGLEKVSVY